MDKSSNKAQKVVRQSINLAKIKKDDIESIVIEWFVAENDFNLQKSNINLYFFEIHGNEFLINNKSRTLVYDIKENGTNRRTIIRQTEKGFTIKSDQYADFNEIPLDVYHSETSALFVMSEPSERMYIRLINKT